MIVWLLIIVLLTLLAMSIAYAMARVYFRRQRARVVQQCQSEIDAWKQRLAFKEWSAFRLPSFTYRLATIENFLPIATLQQLQETALQQTHIDRTYLPGHKKGNTVAYDYLREHAPQLVAFYQSTQLRQLLSDLIGESVMPTPAYDQSSCSLLIYSRPGDHIGWHYDYDFYRGRHFTILLSLENRHLLDTQRLSSAVLSVKKADKVVEVPTPANTLVVFEGKAILHNASRLADNERRILLSMTFCTDPTANPVMDFSRRVKDTAFFGLRALWT